MTADYVYHRLQFKQASGTSRGILKTKDSWYLKLTDRSGHSGIGECSTISKLSPDLMKDLDTELTKLVSAINQGFQISLDNPIFEGLPAMKFAYETAKLDLSRGGRKQLFESGFTNEVGIPINGLVWMGTKDFMFQQINRLLSTGYRCIKIKIAAINFEDELNLISYIRKQFNTSELEIRVDANGGFQNNEALEKLKRLSDYQIHSIEQPIMPGQVDKMAELCSSTPIPIALDEELISINSSEQKEQLLKDIKPQYIILKPSLIGGFATAEEWISLCKEYNIGWWVTSALEANIGLNAIAQWTATLGNQMYQGLGTGQLFTNNIKSPLYIDNAELHYGTGQWQNIIF